MDEKFIVVWTIDGETTHIRLCNWKVERGAPWGGFAELGRRDEK